jgi:hypothetical protein
VSGSKKPKRYTPPKCRKSMRGEPCEYTCRGIKFNRHGVPVRSWLACFRCGKRKQTILSKDDVLAPVNAGSVSVSDDAVEAMRTMRHKINF